MGGCCSGVGAEKINKIMAWYTKCNREKPISLIEIGNELYQSFGSFHCCLHELHFRPSYISVRGLRHGASSSAVYVHRGPEVYIEAS